MNKPSKIFSNGREHRLFVVVYCYQCLNNGKCDTQRDMADSEYNKDAWPSRDIVETEHTTHTCLHFASDDDDIMRVYNALFEEGAP